MPNVRSITLGLLCITIPVLIMYIYSLQTQIHITQNRIRIMEAEKNITAAILKSSMKNMNLSEVKNLIYYGANRTVAAQFNTLEMIDKYTHPMTASLVKRFPRCICIGVAKAGTTALQAFLNMHPTVVAATWEPRFFSRFSHKGYGMYLDKMRYSENWQMSFEKSPQYFARTTTARRIYKFDPSMKILLVLKNPVHRTMSHFRYFDKRRPENKEKSFEDIAFREDNGTMSVNMKSRAVMVSTYVNYLQNWLGIFPSSQIHVVNGDQLIANPVPEMKQVEKFLGIKPYIDEDLFYFDEKKGFYCYKKGPSKRDVCLGGSRGNINPKNGMYANLQIRNVDESTELLRKYFKPYNKELFELVGRKFDWD